jgi:hypothetical protein
MARRRARANPGVDVWLALGAGVALLGAGIYFFTRPAATTSTTGTGALPPSTHRAAIPMIYTARPSP